MTCKHGLGSGRPGHNGGCGGGNNFYSCKQNYHYATIGEGCLPVPQDECTAAGNHLTGWTKSQSEVVVGDWSWVPCGCYIWRGSKIQFNTRACTSVTLNTSGRINAQAICKVRNSFIPLLAAIYIPLSQFSPHINCLLQGSGTNRD